MTQEIRPFTVSAFLRRLARGIIGYAGIDTTSADVLDRFIAKGQFNTTIDVGAHEGAFAMKVHTFLPDCTIHCFEPLPDVFETLKNTMRNVPGSYAYNVALGALDVDAKTMFRNAFSASSSLLPMESAHVEAFPHTAKSSEISITLRTLDSWASTMSLRTPILLKLDVQGYETQVLCGAHNTLPSVNAVLTEVSFKKLYQGSSVFDDVYRALRDAGFEFRGLCNYLWDRKQGELLQADAMFTRWQG